MAASQQSTGSPGFLGLTSYNADGSLVQASFQCDCCNGDLFCALCELAPCNWLAPGFDYYGGPVARATLSAPGCQFDGAVVDLYVVNINCSHGSFDLYPCCIPANYLSVPWSGLCLYGTKSVTTCVLVSCSNGVTYVEKYTYVLCVTWVCADDGRMHLLFRLALPDRSCCAVIYSFGSPLQVSTWNCTNAPSDCNAYCTRSCYNPNCNYVAGAYGDCADCVDMIGSGTCLFWTSQTFQLPIGNLGLCPGAADTTTKQCRQLQYIGCSGVNANWVITP
jgi:hypothetical protein